MTTRVPANISLVLRLPDEHHPETRLEVHSQLDLIMESASARTARQALESALAALADLEPGLFWIDGVAVGGPPGVVVLPKAYLSGLRLLAPMVATRGHGFGPPRCAVDGTTGELVLAGAALGFDTAAARAFDQLTDWPHTWPEPLAPGRYPLRGIGVLHAGHGGPPSGVADLASVAAYLRSVWPLTCLDRSPGPQPTVDQLLALPEVTDLAAPEADDIAGWIDRRLAR